MILCLFLCLSEVSLLVNAAKKDTESNNGKSSSQQQQSEQQQQSAPEYKEMIVHIPQYGKVVGRREEGVDVWRSIPYAAPPVGNLRFAPPQPAQVCQYL